MAIQTPGILSDIPSWGSRLEWNLFLWGGQSNAEGVYPMDGIAQNKFDDIQIFSDDYRWHVAYEPCDNQSGDDCFVDSVNHDSWAGYGATKRFGIEFRYLVPDSKIGIVQCSRGGTSISDWQPNYSDQTLYGAMIKRAYAAQTRGIFKAFIFIQGEGDSLATNYDYALNWDTLFSNIVAAVRYDLDIPNLPVIFAQLANHTGDPDKYIHWELVKQKQANVENIVQNSKMVNMSDTNLTYNSVHYNVSGYNTLAKRIALAYNQLL